MYPNLYYAFKGILGVEWQWLKLINSFGFFVAIAFLAGAWVITKELKRKQAQGILSFTEQTITVGAPASFPELVLNFLFGFIIGFKLVGVFTITNALNNPQGFLLSTQGSVPAGLLIGLAFAGLKWWEKNKTKTDKPEQQTIKVWPHERVGDMVVYAAIFGFIGAKIFHNLENWDDFVKDPIGSLIAFSGLTFYGGLICAAIAIGYYGKKHKMPFIHLADAFAPALMLAYGLGRIGCMVSGDGDWGIVNSAFISDLQGHVIHATHEQFNTVLQLHRDFYEHRFGSLANVSYANVSSFLGLPDWFVAYTYPHNVISEGVNMIGCEGQYCYCLPLPVFPTPLYETITCVILFGILFSIRKRINIAGRIFAIYLIMNGVERFFIELIRVNTVYNILGYHPTQAEIISFALIITGSILYWYAPKLNKPTTKLA